MTLYCLRIIRRGAEIKPELLRPVVWCDTNEPPHHQHSKLWNYRLVVLGTCATFSATAPLAQTEKGGSRRGGAKVKNDSAVAVAQKNFGANCAIFKPNFA